MRPSDSTCTPNQTNFLILFYKITNLNLYLRLMPKSTIDSPAMVNDGCITPYSQQACVNYFTSCRCNDRQPLTTSKIDSAMETFNRQFCPLANVCAPIPKTGCGVSRFRKNNSR